MFESLEILPPDPLLGIAAACRQDPNPNKVDLGVGVYKTEDGKTPILKAVQKAIDNLTASEDSKVYIAPQGNADFLSGMTNLLLGEQGNTDRFVSIQAPGGTGSLRIGSELIAKSNPNATVWASDPTWANHVPLMKSAGLNLKNYPYYDTANSKLKADEMLETFSKLGKDDIVLLHGCCHNPTGEDLTPELWTQVADLAVERGFTPFVDIAYQGFGKNLEEDVAGVREVFAKVPEMIIASSCSKNFGLYRERTGMISFLSENAEKTEACRTNALSIARGIYSMPPSYGAALVGLILKDAELTKLWHEELEEMCSRMNGLRTLLVNKLNERGVEKDFSFIERQNGMFSFLGINKEQIDRLRNEDAIYMAGSSRINIAGISNTNVDYIADAVAKVL
ncbi:aromatic amino acid aminotransferase [Saccharobesus litoralis]|uniref:Aromatic amino acid aminotransferase n=1 Tax=Saccharobesus litoralis TaxID=2172099 RepID=A0A2S0VSK4_9ALTE|nr:amino acid aminotransferase [Saccharobesus litoralis]AWB67198.1 aromatic amino acid aminotransferase [Saccharobesus litoralis]